jgi:hypothetical protein
VRGTEKLTSKAEVIMIKAQLIKYNKIRFDIEDLLFKQEHRGLNELEKTKLAELEIAKHNLLTH